MDNISESTVKYVNRAIAAGLLLTLLYWYNTFDSLY